ncbi:MAG TPA: hypothetical protein VHT31_03655 [Candidatus Acidoferrum sp.]|nr:hypothetical protein [Candidatus Acidoferrum sp.]
MEQTPLRPAFRASSHNWVDQKTVTIRIDASGHFKRIKREAFNPSITGHIEIHQCDVCVPGVFRDRFFATHRLAANRRLHFYQSA